MKVRLHNVDGQVVKEYELPNDAVPTPLVVIDGATDILYTMQQSGNAYDYYPVNYHILGVKSEVMVGVDGLMYWGRKATVNAK
jgi:hypothetical protein